MNIKADPNGEKATVQMSNIGGSSATNVKLTVEAPFRIYKYDLFTTENYSKIQANSSILELFMPRLIQGVGSYVLLDIWLDPSLNQTGTQRYISYVTHDRGSLKSTAVYSEGKASEASVESGQSYEVVLSKIVTIVRLACPFLLIISSTPEKCI